MVSVPLKPIGKEDVRKLELALIFGTLFRPDVVERIRAAEDRLTWLDSLVVAAGALARERAGYTISSMAEELGRSEATIRNHLQGKTEAGKLVKETYEMLVRSKGELEIRMPEELGEVSMREKELEREVKELREKIEKVKRVLEDLLKSL